MSEFTSRQEAVLEAARLLSLEQRTAYLDKVCGASGPEREQLDALLNNQTSSEPT